MIVGTLGKALGSYGAYVCADAARRPTTWSTRARPFIFSTAPPPPAVAAALAALELLERAAASGSSGCGATRATLREALAARGPRRAAAREPRSCRSWSATPSAAMDALRARAGARRLRPGDPPADRARGLLAAALHGDGRRHRAARSWPARRAAASARRARARPSGADAARGRRSTAAPPMAAACAGVFVTGTGTEVGKTVVAAAICARARRATGARGGGLQAGGHRPRRRAGRDGRRPRAAARAPPASSQSDDEIAPYRYGPPVSPHLAAELAGEAIDPARLRRRRRAPRPPAPTRSSARASAACSCRSPPATSSATSPSTWAARS